jgi:hypothetical protein
MKYLVLILLQTRLFSRWSLPLSKLLTVYISNGCIDLRAHGLKEGALPRCEAREERKGHPEEEAAGNYWKIPAYARMFVFVCQVLACARAPAGTDKNTSLRAHVCLCLSGFGVRARLHC